MGEAQRCALKNSERCRKGGEVVNEGVECSTEESRRVSEDDEVNLSRVNQRLEDVPIPDPAGKPVLNSNDPS